MSEFIKRQEEARANLFSQIKETISSAEAESRGLDSAELEKIDRIEADIQATERSIETARKNEERMAEVSVVTADVMPQEDRSNDELRLAALHAGESRSEMFEYRALTKDDSNTPRGFADQVIIAARSAGPILETSEVFNTTTGEEIIYPVLNSFSTAALRAEGSALPESDPTISNITLGAFKYGVLIAVSNELLTDAGFNLESVIAEQAGNSLGYILNSEHTTGDGTGNPNGIVTAAGSGITGVGTAGGFTAEELIDLVYSIDPAYRSRQSAGFMASTTAVAAMRKLQDTAGNFLYDVRVGEPDNFAGYRVFENVHMSAVGTDAKSIIFGDLGAYKVRLAQGVSVASSSDYAFNTDQTFYRVTARADGDLADANAVKYFIGSATP